MANNVYIIQYEGRDGWRTMFPSCSSVPYTFLSIEEAERFLNNEIKGFKSRPACYCISYIGDDGLVKFKDFY